MGLDPIPVDRLLVPAEFPALPPGSEIVEDALVNGLPHQLRLGSVATALLIAPTGLAVDWRDVDPAARLSASEEALAAQDPARPARDLTARPPARLLVRRADGGVLGAVPLVARLTVHLPLGESNPGAAIELTILAWDLRAGNLRGPGDFGGRISVAWRRTDRAASRFEPPPVHPMLVLRTPPAAPAAEPIPGSPPQQAPLPAPGAVQFVPLDLMASELGLTSRVWRDRKIRGFIP